MYYADTLVSTHAGKMNNTPQGPAVFTVSQLNRQSKELLETYLHRVQVSGEISNLARPHSGHWYFTLKDQRAQVRCAMFKSRSQYVQFAPKEGDQVLIHASVSLYEARGDYQLIVDKMESAGEGALKMAFEALKARLHQQGYFNPEYKKPLPSHPRHLGIVTSPTGAAVKDIIAVLKRRFPALPISIYPTQVQGEVAAGQIVQAIERANRDALCDVLIVGRGGGSLEDLWPFNEERVAHAIFNSAIPIISAVGHEVDTSISDFVADLRAATPSAAAELVSPDRFEWLGALRAAATPIDTQHAKPFAGSAFPLNAAGEASAPPQRQTARKHAAPRHGRTKAQECHAAPPAIKPTQNRQGRRSLAATHTRQAHRPLAATQRPVKTAPRAGHHAPPSRPPPGPRATGRGLECSKPA